jgi:uncharacterized protein (DUF427 family)
MLTPGPDHPITLEPGKRRWRAEFKNHVIADSNGALILREADHRPVVYFPRADVAMEYMGRTEHHTRCPYKGDASYYTLTMDGEILENGVWSYEHPFDAMEAIAGRIAFYPGRVEVYEVDDAVVNPPHHDRRDDEVQAMLHDQERRLHEPRSVDEVVQHTDAGDGLSQGEHWPANVDRPQAGEGGVR